MLLAYARLMAGETLSFNPGAPIKVDMGLKEFFFVGETGVSYSSVCGASSCTTVFRGFVNDGFWDPLAMFSLNGRGDGPGPTWDLPGGKPYAFIPHTWSITYKNKFDGGM
jgi:hypothetical protein